jgi:hypothetical protein
MIQGISQCPPHLGCVGFRPQRSDSEMLMPPSPRSFIPLVPLASQAERRIDRDIYPLNQVLAQEDVMVTEEVTRARANMEWVVPTNEELMIAQHTLALVRPLQHYPPR